MTYRIISPRVGVPGEEYVPSDDTNVDALIAGGFIESTGKTSSKSARTTSETTVPDADNNEHQE